MKIKRYFAADMREAIRKVRQDQGPDAVILSSKSVNGGVELVAALDYDESLVPQMAGQAQDQMPETETIDTPAETAAAGLREPRPRVAAYESARAAASGEAPRVDMNKVEWGQDPTITAMQHEIRDLKVLLSREVAHLAWGDFSRRHPTGAELLQRLSALGLRPDHARHIAEIAGRCDGVEAAWSAALDQIARELPVVEADPLADGGVIALVGATGVGKTTSVAKLAARFALQHGQRHSAMISTDSFRIGAHEQLLTYGRILGAPVQVASDAGELDFALENFSDKRLVLIDTAGMSQRDMRMSEQLAALQATGVAVRIYLVLSANSQAAVLDEVVSSFRKVPLQGCLLTKVDEAASLGGALSVITRHRVPLAWIGDGQRVPEDLHPARAQSLVSRAQSLLSEMPVELGEMELAERFGKEVSHGAF